MRSERWAVMLKRIVLFVLISMVIYIGIASALIIFGTPTAEQTDVAEMRLDELVFDDSGLPDFRWYRARDGRDLPYRYYPSNSTTALVLIHGSGGHSRYFLPLASFVSKQDLAAVFTPDLRGHGHAPEIRGDIAYIGQFEDDLADLIAHIEKDRPASRIIVGGHSSGGGLAIRFGGSRYGQLADAYLLLAPYLRYDAPTFRAQSGWATPYTGRIIGLSMLGNVGIHWFDFLQVIEFNLPRAYRDGTETLGYTHRLNTAFAPRDYPRELEAMTQPVKVIVGADDKVFDATQYAPAMSPHTDVDVSVLPGVSHIGVVVGEEIRPVLSAWLRAVSQ